eukprot:CAMPEP_0194479954 /NCGR_PEP_ID=MMETSP0253-20130528/2914_1 /TAXON_ID=2966 /ORGANISM="Noctiluca scintillans" /LENGTH=60 /DNA_ID=CAMNT_0039319261 /DNA_START=976 /DNA_END=1159 /DNA_ORIENTATION=-
MRVVLPSLFDFYRRAAASVHRVTEHQMDAPPPTPRGLEKVSLASVAAAQAKANGALRALA